MGYNKLPAHVHERANKQFQLWEKDHYHPSVHFKKVGKYWSARVTGSYRAVGLLDGDTIVWFFIGTHAEYDRLLS
ncbi:MAG: ParE family toxin-like protein [Roseibacillus sp.]